MGRRPRSRRLGSGTCSERAVSGMCVVTPDLHFFERRMSRDNDLTRLAGDVSVADGAAATVKCMETPAFVYRMHTGGL